MSEPMRNASARAMWIEYLLNREQNEMTEVSPGAPPASRGTPPTQHGAPSAPHGARPAGLASLPASPDAWAFGLGAEMETHLAELVVAGVKRATASSLEGMLFDGDPMPQRGDHSIILDGAGVARCIIRSTQVCVARFCDVPPEFAAREGEGDGTLEYWRDAHARFFAREHRERGFAFHDRIPVVLQDFAVVWPPEYRDA